MYAFNTAANKKINAANGCLTLARGRTMAGVVNFARDMLRIIWNGAGFCGAA
jgi:hypothetical protein